MHLATLPRVGPPPQLLAAGYNVTIVDNLSNSSVKVLSRIRELSGAGDDRLEFDDVDLRNEAALKSVFERRPFRGVVHFAAFKAVGESRLKPITYFDNNLVACIGLMKVMGKVGCKTLIFSSSCTVYGENAPPLAEDAPTGAGITNAYGRSKHIMEQMLLDVHAADSLEGHEYPAGGPWRVCVLRYFNPVGAHPSGRMGEDPRGVPNCLMPYVLQTLVGRRDRLTVFGSDYDTRDGTCVRDYIHVCDVAAGHADALRWIGEQAAGPLHETFNFGEPGASSSGPDPGGRAFPPAARSVLCIHSLSFLRPPTPTPQEPARGRACWSSWRPLRRPPGGPAPRPWGTAGRATCRKRSATLPRPRPCSGGRRSTASTPCASTRGGGSRRTRPDTTERRRSDGTCRVVTSARHE